MTTNIEWCWPPGYKGESWNPVRALNRETHKVGWHCEHVTEACTNCYAEAMNKRLGTGLPYKPGHRDDIDIILDEDVLLKPLAWKAPRAIFVHSMTDTFADFVSDDWLDRLFAVMALCQQHIFIVLTKRPKRMRTHVLRPQFGKEVEIFNWPLPNVWCGTSVHDQPSADEFIPELLATTSAVRFISYEPALGPLRLHETLGDDWLASGKSGERRGLDWVICGGESGPHKRPADLQWFRDTRDQCADAGVSFFQKQIDKVQPIPPDLLIRQFPEEYLRKRRIG